MATLYGVNANKRDVLVPSQKIDGADQNGRHKVFYDEITLSAELAVSDVILLSKLPKGARIIQAVLNTGALGGSCAGTLGWTASADGVEAASAAGLIAAPTLATAARSRTAAEAGAFKKLAAEVQVALTISAVSTTGVGKTIQVMVEVALP